MQKPTISEILHRAADEFLVDDYYESHPDKERYSCIAVDAALIKYKHENALTESEVDDFWIRIETLMENMGLVANSLEAFCPICLPDCIRYSKKIQGARYAWLKFAAMIAEEQGV